MRLNNYKIEVGADELESELSSYSCDDDIGQSCHNDAVKYAAVETAFLEHALCVMCLQLQCGCTAEKIAFSLNCHAQVR